jgi:hypothetical protein
MPRGVTEHQELRIVVGFDGEDRWPFASGLDKERNLKGHRNLGAEINPQY